MGQRVPAVVGLYFREAGQGAQWRRIAEFRLTAEGHATFRAVDPVEGLVARVWYHQGVDILGENRTVLPSEGAAFLRALLQPFGFRDYWFRDDSSPRSGFTRTGHALSRSTPVVSRELGESDWAAGESECGGYDEGRSAQDGPRRHPSTRPAAWRVLDADTIHF
ncbi:hypothetical protein VMT65_03775 [Nocardia sp. CDC153]|uniref:hypothetical protein n=1 Tax=Nocardia sp. CDC153 TaxID=3112167 RepID=UPI002DBBDDCA|nr:hypothetical protein [Nocardia sp. CDC153]MEC3952146.1 hypothetical protein [Nocardia sp. CDC153]